MVRSVQSVVAGYLPPGNRPLGHDLGVGLLALLLAPSIARADVTMPAIFGDGMVLQREARVAVWGRAEPGEAIEVRLGSEKKSARTDDEGEWQVFLDPRPVGDPLTLTVEGNNLLQFEDVLFGEVWIGAGQSNMGLPVRCCRPAEKRLTALPNVRLYQQDSWQSSQPEWEGAGFWVRSDQGAALEFSGTLYFFGTDLHQALDVPIGLIQVSLGGTRIESWMSAESQFGNPVLAPFVKADDAAFKSFDLEKERNAHEVRAAIWDKQNPEATARDILHRRPRGSFEMHMRVGNVSGLFNGKIAPLIPFTIRGVVWYQGENNAKKPELYQTQLTQLIRDWRALWGQGDFPFAWVQLPNFAKPERGEQWPEMREAMRKTLSEPNTGMAITIDVGQSRNIHPWNKQAVGRRLACWALGSIYGWEVHVSGPLYASHEVVGAQVIVRFDHAYEGLQVRGPAILGFEVSDAEGVWHAAQAEAKSDTVVVECKEVAQPTGVRFNWSNDPVCTLFGPSNVPASPFMGDV